MPPSAQAERSIVRDECSEGLSILQEGRFNAENRPFKAPFNSKSKVRGRNDMGDDGQGRSWLDEMPVYPESRKNNQQLKSLIKILTFEIHT